MPPDNLVDIYTDAIITISNNLRRPRGRIPHPNHNASIESIIAATPFAFGTESQMKLSAACNIVQYHTTFG